MGAKVSRNDPCPCGSGKKYKKCCMQSEATVSTGLDWQRIQRTHEGLIPKILEFVSRQYGPLAIHEAWEEFHLFEETEFDPDSPVLQAFMPWFFYNWIPDPEASEVESGAPFDLPPAEALIALEGTRLTKLEKEYVQACCDRAYSFYEIKDFNRGTDIDVKDLLTGEMFTVDERKGSENAVRGNIFFGKVILVQARYLFDGLAPIQIPARYGINIVDFREGLKKDFGREITNEDLFDFEEILLEMFWNFWDALMDPSPPVLTNTEGHLFIPHKLVYEIDSISEMFEKLHGLCFSTSKEELLESASYSKLGEIIEIDFPWLGKGNKKHKSWDNTVLGHIFLTESKMVVDVNSKERATRFKALLSKEIKKGWSLKSTLVEPIESKLAERVRSGMGPPESSNEELMELPEMKARMEAMLKDHWKNWVDEPLPTLSGKSPKSAAKTRVGREKLEILLADFESKAAKNPMPGQTVETFIEIRKILGL